MKTVAEVLRAGKWQEAPAAFTPARVLCRRDCSVCGGVGYVRYDVPMGHPYFGKAQPCPKIPPESSLHENHGLTIKEIQSLDWSNLVVRENVQEGISVVKEYISRGSGMIYIYGGPGLAKTVLLKIACAIWARSGSRGIPVHHTKGND